MHRRAMKIVVLVAAAGALVLSSCSSTSSSGSATVHKNPDGKGKTLKVWYYEPADSAMGIAWKQAIKDFEQQTGAKVKFELKAFEQINQSASQVLNSSAAPDVMEYNKGNATAGLLSSQGLLTDLDKAVQAYGWDNSLAPSLQTTARYSAKGVMGSGDFYGIPNYGEYVEMYYNKDAFAKYGIAVPTTFAQLEQAMATFKAHGVTALSESAQEYPLGQLLYQLALSKANRDWVTKYQTYTGKVDFHDAAWTFAANTIKDWVKKGYISKNASGLKAQDAGDAFTAGTNPMFFSGSWWYGGFVTSLKFQWGTFLFPDSAMSPGSSGNLWVVPVKGKNKDLANKFIDVTMSKKIQNLMGNHGGIPVAPDPGAITDERSKELDANFAVLTKRDGLGFYPDWPTSTFYNQLNAALQELLNGSTSPSGMLSKLGDEYSTGVKKITR